MVVIDWYIAVGLFIGNMICVAVCAFFIYAFYKSRQILSAKVEFMSDVDNRWLPRKAFSNDACYDVFAAEDAMIGPGGTCKIPLGFCIELPEGYEAQIRPRSGMSLKTNAKVLFGTVDSGYRGEVSAIIFNSSDVNLLEIHKGDKIAQMALRPVDDLMIVAGRVDNNTERGTGGFGSTGK